MTSSSYKKVLKQISHKKTKANRFLKFNKPKTKKYGRGIRKCRRCGRRGAHIRKYGLNVCRQCFREIARDLGFEKYGHEV